MSGIAQPPAADPVKIDPTDLKLLAALARDGRMSIKALAEEIGLSTAPTQARMKRLETLRVIRGYRAQVDPQILGWHTTGFVELLLSNKGSRQDFEAALAAMPGLIEAHRMAGHWDYLVKVQAADTATLIAVLTKEVSELPHVEETRISLATRTIYSAT